MARTLLRKPPQDPPSFFKTPGALLSRANQLYEAFEQGMRDIGAMAGTQEPTFQNLLLPIAHLENEWEFEKDCLEFLTLYSPDESLRSAAKEISVIVEKGHTVQDTLWEFIKAVCDKKEELDTESQRFKETEMEGYMAKACHLPTISSNRMKEIDKMLYQINTDFKANLANESGGIWFSEAELAGVSEEDIQELSRGTGENEGKLRVRFKSNYSTILARAKDPDVRKRLWSGMQNSSNDNVPLFKKAVALHHEKATLLGYPNYATFATGASVMKDLEGVRKLLLKFKDRVSRTGQTESLTKAKLNDTEVIDKTLYPWDKLYYRKKSLKADYAVHCAKVSEYFPLDSTIRAMFTIFEELFGIEFEKYTGDVWHEDVELLSVWDNEDLGGEFLGYLYLDLFERPGKPRAASSYRLRPGFLSRDGIKSYTASTLLCNFGQPTPTQPSLLKHEQVVTVFHEQGHCIHVLLSRTKYARFNGFSNTLDFVETPSQMLENWCWSAGPLKRLGAHFKTGQAIPDDLINNLLRTKSQHLKMLDHQQIHLATFNLAAFTPASQKDAEEMDLAELNNRIRFETTGLKTPESLGKPIDWGHSYVTSGHQMVYPGTLYQYISGFCFSEIMFKKVFANDPMNKKVGLRYRRLILEKGGSQHPLEMMENLLGEKPDIEAFCDNAVDE